MRRATPVPGDALLQAAPLAAAALLAANDLLLKPRAPGRASGKLSDVAINFLLPVVLVAALEWARLAGAAVRRAPFRPAGRGAVLLACLASAAYFALLEVWPPFAGVHAAVLGALTLGGPRPFASTTDPSDLLTLAATPLAGWFLARRAPRAP